jgi:hypothetical protein
MARSSSRNQCFLPPTQTYQPVVCFIGLSLPAE